MSNPLVVNPETGFLESPSPNHSAALQANYFNSARKVEFLRLADECIKMEQYPAIHLICQSVGVSPRTFEYHLKYDKAFLEAWEERKAALRSVFTVKLAYKADSKLGTLANLAVLRYLESGTWNPETRINHVNDGAGHKPLVNALNQVVDAEIVVDSGDNRAVLPNQGDALKQ